MMGLVVDSPDALFNAIGIIGMIIILLAYFMLQLERWQSHSPRYLYANIIGSHMVMESCAIYAAMQLDSYQWLRLD